MKTILVLTDFSSSAKNAVHYAAALAKEFHAKLLLFHAYNLPLPPVDMPYAAVSLKELQESNESVLSGEAKRLWEKYRVKAVPLVRAGFAVEQVLGVEKKFKPGIIIAGMKGKSNAERILIGSTVTGLIGKVKTPLLVIPERKKFHKPERILFACDYASPVSLKTIAPARELAKKFHSEIYVVNIAGKNGTRAAHERAVLGMKLERQLRGLHYVYYFPRNEDVLEGMNLFLRRHKADMIAMIPHRHSFVERLFRKSFTKQMAYRSSVPLLVMPEGRRLVPA